MDMKEILAVSNKLTAALDDFEVRHLVALGGRH